MAKESRPKMICNISMKFTAADLETAKRILDEAENLIRQRVTTASEPPGRIIKCETSYWERG